MSHRPPSPRNRSVVRVGVRVRPLTSKEIVQDGGISKPALSCHGNREIRLGTERRFTYDTVFDERTQQDELYRSVAPPLLESFIDGYNATVRSMLESLFMSFGVPSQLVLRILRLWRMVKQVLARHSPWGAKPMPIFACQRIQV